METFQYQRFASAFNDEKKRREEKGEQPLTKTMVWKAAGRSSGIFAQWYNGDSGMSLEACFKVAPILRVNPYWLFDGSQDREATKDASLTLVKSEPSNISTKRASLSRRAVLLGDLFDSLPADKQFAVLKSLNDSAFQILARDREKLNTMAELYKDV